MSSSNGPQGAAAEGDEEAQRSKVAELKLKDQNDMLELTIQHLIAFSQKEESEHEVIRKIASAATAAQAAGSSSSPLTGTILNNGATNYAYKIYLKEDPDAAVFCKTGFSRALWDPDPTQTYDLRRLTCEMETMRRFQFLMLQENPTLKRAPVATAITILHLNEDTRSMIAEWVSADRIWAQQFLDGQVDRRLISQVAHAFATVNTTPNVDPQLNEEMKQVFRSLHETFRQMNAAIVEAGIQKEEPRNVCNEYIASMTKEDHDAMFDALRDNYNQQEVLVHGDSHVFNILVESMLPDEQSTAQKQFGPHADFNLCDWEMVCCGPKGRDCGVFFSWPILSAFFLAAQRREACSHEIMDMMDEFWTCYTAHLRSKGGRYSDETYLRDVFRNVVAYAGYYLYFAWYVLNLPQGQAPVESLPASIGKTVHSVCGKVGMQFLEMGFVSHQHNPEWTLDELRTWFQTTIEEQIAYCTKLREECGE